MLISVGLIYDSFPPPYAICTHFTLPVCPPLALGGGYFFTMDLLYQILSLLGFVLFHISLLAGLILIPIGLPGSWLVLASAFLFAALTGFEDLTRNVLLLLLSLAVLGEVMELLLGLFVAKRYGATKLGLWGAFFGGLFGGIAGTAAFPLIGSLVGAMLGAFIGAFLMECLNEVRTEVRLRAGFGALIGRVVAITMKLGIALVMVFIILFRLYF
ncbi:MAG: DUF456 family protein [Candidatus Glassbacteria bacterium]